MSEEYSVEIVNPEKSFLSKDDVTEVVVPAFEGEIGILKDHIPLITFLRPGKIKIKDINELEIVDNKIFANSYQLNNDIGLIIDKDTGAVNGVINFKGLRDRVKQHPELDVINGIAYNKDRKTFFVTGKKWDKIFEIEIFKQ